MPQISPMKWFLLNLLTQSSIMQIVSFLNSKKTFTSTQECSKLLNSKMSWKW